MSAVTDATDATDTDAPNVPNAPHVPHPTGFDPSRPFGVAREDRVYATVDGEELLCTVYSPTGDGAPRTGRQAIVDLHGGAWRHFDRSVDANYDRALAKCGAVVVSLDFRQAPDHRWPSAAADANAGVRWVKAHAQALGVDPDHVGILGGSSGGHLALVTALCPTRPELTTTVPAGVDLAASSTLGAACAWAMALWPVAEPDRRYRYLLDVLADPDFTTEEPMFVPEALVQAQDEFFGSIDVMAAASVVRILREGEAEQVPPLWVAQPEHDGNVTIEMTRDLVEAWGAAGCHDVSYTLFPGVGHSFANFPIPEAEACIEKMIAFVTAHLP